MVLRIDVRVSFLLPYVAHVALLNRNGSLDGV